MGWIHELALSNVSIVAIGVAVAMWEFFLVWEEAALWIHSSEVIPVPKEGVHCSSSHITVGFGKL